ncbi:MAG: SH3 domain-containing protein [Fusobacteriaceae bacterium]|nr:SH3 domain-containing protein [Fusobacteriaceae bacterium]MBN2838688.1 SH3 domain-containing protein [Fusobacteriaceae bacterium]
MNNFFNFLCILAIISISIFGSEYKEGDILHVWKEDGAKLMKEPSSDGKFINQLAYGTKVEVIEQDSKKSTSMLLYLDKYNNSKVTKVSIQLDSYWLKIKVGNKIGYVCRDYLLKYIPIELEFRKDKEYLISYFRENFGMDLIEADYKYYEIEKDYFKDVYKYKYASYKDRNVLEEKGGFIYKVLPPDYERYEMSQKDGKGTKRLLNIKIKDMSFNEAITFFTLIFNQKSYEDNLSYEYKAEKELSYNITSENNFDKITVSNDGVIFEKRVDSEYLQN